MKVLTLNNGRETLSEVKLREVTTDPVATAGEAWVLRTHEIGSPIGLLLALTYSVSKYELSFKTEAGTVMRNLLS